MAAVELLTHEVYNNLPNVDAQDRRFNALPNNETILKELAALFTKHQVDPYFGVFLLHAHNPINADECMIERQVGDALITATETITNLKSEEVYPSRWGFVNGKWIALEYATDAAYKHAVNSLNHEFLAELGAFLTENNIADLLGLVLAKRTIWPNEQQTFAERTDERGNVIVLKNASEVNESYLATIYCFGQLAPRAVAFCLKIVYCQKIGPGHIGIVGHKKI
jgi:hypothetical protein